MYKAPRRFVRIEEALNHEAIIASIASEAKLLIGH